MGIVIHSPFSGRPVKVRDQDAGRAVKDEEGRLFYVLQRSDGSGYYGAPTRAGGQRDEQRYDTMLAKQTHTRQVGAERSAAQIAAGQRSRGRGGLIKLIIVLAVLAAGAWAVLYGPLSGLLG